MTASLPLPIYHTGYYMRGNMNSHKSISRSFVSRCNWLTSRDNLSLVPVHSLCIVFNSARRVVTESSDDLRSDSDRDRERQLWWCYTSVLTQWTRHHQQQHIPVPPTLPPCILPHRRPTDCRWCDVILSERQSFAHASVL